MRKLILSMLGICVVAAAAWSVSTILHDGGPPLPGRSIPQVATANPPAVPPQQSPATQPVSNSAIAPDASFLLIEYHPASPGEIAPPPEPRQFPPARVRFSGKADEAGNVLLFSDDPKEAINKDWVGDRYEFAMPSETPITGRRQLDGFHWSCSTSPGQDEETTNGIYLHGDQYHLEPQGEARIDFKRIDGELKVSIDGEFMQIDSANPNSPPRHCHVSGLLSPRVDVP